MTSVVNQVTSFFTGMLSTWKAALGFAIWETLRPSIMYPISSTGIPGAVVNAVDQTVTFSIWDNFKK